MARSIRRVLIDLPLLVAATLCAQTPSHVPAPEISLGHAAAPLYRPWKFTIGDSPIDAKTGKPLWAEPDFDDSQWETVDLTPKAGETDPVTGEPGSVPGWTARGHAAYWGFAWYRIRVRVAGASGQKLALNGPDLVDDAYQLYADGELLGSFGDFSKNRPVIYSEQPVMFRLPDYLSQSPGTRVFAFRLWMDPTTLITTPNAGGMHTAPVLGEAAAVALDYESKLVELYKPSVFDAVLTVLFGALTVVAFSLIFFDRSDPTYLWIGLLFLVSALHYCMAVLDPTTEIMPIVTYLRIAATDSSIMFGLWCVVWWVWFGRPGRLWVPRAIAGLTIMFAVSLGLGADLYPTVVSHQAALRWYVVFRVVLFAFFALLAWIVGHAIRRHAMDAWLVLPVIVLRGIALFMGDLEHLHVPVRWFPFGIQVNLGQLADLLIAPLIALLLLRRLVQSLKRQKEVALDIKQAQEVQEVILPEHRIVLPGLEIESEYRPAREVGGDFFQIIPQAHDGLLIVAGDVAGKGLKAGMLVALLVGAIRQAAESEADPAAILAALNRRLLGRGDARATCLAIRIAQDGGAVLANAGHLPPYLNGAPMEIEGSLPLGLIENFDCSVVAFRLSPSDRLLLLSDGVAEATDENGTLYGFDRVQELVRTQPSAQRIAEAAQMFGQQDDISVIAVTKVPVTEPALA